ncbi:hypothetical protein GOA97_01920 [Sinorhizobium meliloti]|nr:hypothetical protein [Sinorhizobium meliloti]MDW9653265.1 hypothetical protein [Sinorhizobium meliloti]MDW9913229.1 hypothetical protein [Sinorhizobium meliloti]MDW9940067.1 hypothetical protein [Sinorhizobium meliloti]MDW9944331.1 hypothetical protein [Sinorhizobium meliloti]
MTDITEGLIRLDSLVMDPVTQIRRETCKKTIKEYQAAMRAGAEFPPITVAQVDPEDETKGFILIDGWHRVLAAKALGLIQINARVISETDPKRYRWIAAQGNRSHGLRLSREDKREVFRAYVKAGEHRTGRGTRIKSAREMARDLQGIVSDRRIPEWMKQDFPKVYRAMLGSGLEQNPEADFGKKDMDETYSQLATAALDQFKASFHAIKDRSQRQGLLEAIVRTAEDVSGGRALPVITPDEF